MEYILFLLLIVGGPSTGSGQAAYPALTTAMFGDHAACLMAAKVLKDKAMDAGLGVAAVCLPRGSQDRN